MKYFGIGIILILFFTGCSAPVNKEIPVSIGEQTFVCEVVETEEAQAQGLMNRKELPQNKGMLFVFKQPRRSTFWMKNTLMPLDIVWIDAKKKVIQFKTVPPCTTDPCQTISSQKNSKWVLEVNAGEFTGKVGDKVEFEQ